MDVEVCALRAAELGNAAHLVIDRDSGTAGVIDSARDVDRYLELAAGAGAGC